ncbi:MAG: CDP-alcohol phosphatidyltransferase family protein [Clostridia bacterium]|nr:CDP-alcohol phosphatidyltransferase family protein [Clostridia bacterium]
MKLNVPNMLTMLRIILIPVFVACMIYIENPVACGIVSAIIFAVTAFTDFLDGYIARKYNQITDFGKFMDAVADKLMVFSALLALTAKFAIAGQKTLDVGFSLGNGVTVTTNVVAEVMFHVLLWSSIIVFLRELGVTSIRLVCAKTDVGVIPANFFGKAKTVCQIAAVIVILIEFAINEGQRDFTTYYIASYILIALMLFMTVASGLNYLKIYGKHINPNK